MTDEELLTEYLKTKDQELFTILYERMYRPMYLMALRVLHSPEDAEDIAQNAFVNLCEVEPEPIQSAESFLFKMVQNLAIDQMRSARRGMQGYSVSFTALRERSNAWFSDGLRKPAQMDLLEEPIDERADSPAERAEKHDLWEKIKETAKELPPAQQRAIEVYYDRGLTIPETAEVLGIEESTAETLIRRARNRLRKMLVPIEDRPQPLRDPSKLSSEGHYATAV